MKRWTDESGTSSEVVDAELGDESDMESKGRGAAKSGPCFCHIRCLHPETSQFLEVWDFFFLFILAIIAVMIPLEVAFVTYDDELCHPGWRFTLDAILLADMSLQSFIAYPDKKCPSRYIKDPRMITINYLKTWFVVDLISTFPCHAVERGRMPEIRLVRMLRLHSIFPILSRRQVRVGISYAALSLLKFVCGLTFTCHWMACCWAGVAYEVSDEYTWLKAVEAAKGGLKATYHSRSGIYCLSLYWAIMTLTSIGYGDITPQTEKEYLVASLCMLAMATVWAFVIGQMCAVVSTLLPHDVAFKRTMDDLNWLLKDSQMPEPLRMKLRRYFIESRSLCRLHEQKAIIAQMSPMLQGEVSEQLVDEWIHKVPYVKAMSADALAQVARKLKPMLFAPTEAISGERSLYIIRRGVCMRGGRILVTGDVWGKDMILSNELLRDNSQARSLSYLEVLVLRHLDLRDSVATHEGTAVLRSWQRWLGLSRGISLLAKEIRGWERHEKGMFSGLPQSTRLAVMTSILRGTFNGHVPTGRSSFKKMSTCSLSSISTQPSSGEGVVECTLLGKDDAAVVSHQELNELKSSMVTLTQSVETLQQMVRDLSAS